MGWRGSFPSWRSAGRGPGNGFATCGRFVAPVAEEAIARVCFHVRRRHTHSLILSVTNQLQQMMIFHILDPVGQYNKSSINLVELAAIEQVAQLLTMQPQRMPS